MASNEAIEAFLAEPRNAIVIGVRRDGTPQATPNWFSWDGQRFYVSTTRKRAKYPIFKRDPRVTLLIDDSGAQRYVAVSGTVEVGDDLEQLLPIFRRTRENHGVSVPNRRGATRVVEGRGPRPARHHPERTDGELAGERLQVTTAPRVQARRPAPVEST